MKYLTKDEFISLGFEDVENFETLVNRAESIIDIYTNYFYSGVDYETDIKARKEAVKVATALQVKYYSDSGILTAEDKQAINAVSIGRTSINYGNSTNYNKLNMSVDTEMILKSVGFGYLGGVSYDR